MKSSEQCSEKPFLKLNPAFWGFIGFLQIFHLNEQC